ncbi:3,4-dihydroxy-2-butanone-4-phosphate synthase [Rothia sp. AR01]|uniref:3,4-dihydroxy-2-butanone 4-phosphate synthase n=1 Tax=Rothia santali TaxID=2949643 RepID=A0A9X2HA01_9MICC|nr:3,4-dihydroxy-2-butanone-4-phosphate synthase [Rothia santali]MCP3425744.1 3,4-dihydroxy-2-butanone-4-phosphate synthase [Rothia santali]
MVDDEDRENEGDLVGAAALADPERLGMMIRYSSGVVCAPMTGRRADALALPPMVARNEDPKGTAYTITCDAAAGVSTGISAADRALTLNLLADARTAPADLTRPGHILPLRAVDGGVAERPGHTEASVELARLAGLPEVGYIAELVHDDGSMMRFDALRRFATEHGLPMISIEALAAYAAEDAETTQNPTEEELRA